jgi:hypothetical protein
VIALAAFDDWADDQARACGAQRLPGCWLRYLPDDPRKVGEIVFANDSALTVYRQVVNDAVSLAVAVAQRSGDAHIRRERVTALLGAVKALYAHSSRRSAVSEVRAHGFLIEKG